MQQNFARDREQAWPYLLRRQRRRYGEEHARLDEYVTANQIPPWGDMEDIDLEIIYAPRDGSDESRPFIPALPNDEFSLERTHGVTHAFGRQLGEDGRETLWMHFLAGVALVDEPNEQSEWIKWGFALTWLPKTASCDDTVLVQLRGVYSVVMVTFAPPDKVAHALSDFIDSRRWTNATVDPYVLVDIALLSWYRFLDRLVWGVTTLVRIEEQDVFDRTRLLLSDESSVGNLDLHRLHTSAKNAVFMLEALDAALRLVEAAVSAHEDWAPRDNTVSENTHRNLRHRLELFHSTRLRVLSCQASINNTVNLASHINTARDSRANIRSSRSMHIISIIGLVFIPFNTITAVFGTQFFTPQADGDHIAVDRDSWILFAISVPVTVFILAIWMAIEHGDSHKPDRDHHDSALRSIRDPHIVERRSHLSPVARPVITADDKLRRRRTAAASLHMRREKARR
ncbi:hypothetical protein VTH06DRAFT_5834 [Thermothelomyces fergusii]